MDVVTPIDKETAGIIVEFLEIAFHLILYIREVYPAAIFEKRKAYGVPVPMSRNKDLNDYIGEVLTAIQPWLIKGLVHRVALVVLSKSDRPVERFVFEMESVTNHDKARTKTREQITQDLRAFCLKINVCDSCLQSNPPDCTFTILVHTDSSANIPDPEEIIVPQKKRGRKAASSTPSVFNVETPDQNEFPWVPAEEDEIVLEAPTVTPLKSADWGNVKIQLLAQEARDKTR
eukprot:m.19988 g.19988  ORF g.19988 m.19988 type:complete len:232 (+) comp12360_c0_seq1:88-783(+)